MRRLAQVSMGILLFFHLQSLHGQSLSPVADSKLEFLPIVSYDTDTGLGYGGKVFALGYLRWNESFDVVLFNSTKGERWYRFVFSVPDFELRQGTVHPWALDLAIDYDKWIANGFCGVGNNSAYANREKYTRETIEMSATMSRGFSPELVFQLGLRYKTVANSNFEPLSKLEQLPPALNASRATSTSAFVVGRYDTRNSYVNPTHGIVLQVESEFAPKTGMSNVTFSRFGGWVQSYNTVFFPRTVLAIRFGLQGVTGDNLPVQMLLPIGGNRTVRGFPQDRFLDKVAAVGNVEVRFPILWRFGGMLGFDAGKVWPEFSQMDLARWATNPTVGLRFYMDTFVVRLDMGMSQETTGIYMNFGHLF